MRRAFTLIELLVIIVIIAVMATVGVVSLNASRAATRQFSAARAVMAMVRRARSQALVAQKPVVITYSNTKVDEEDCVCVKFQSDKLFSMKKAVERVQSLSGEVLVEASDGTGDANEGETIEDILSPESIPQDVMLGLKIKVLDETDELNLPEKETRQSKISIFSTADNISRTLTPSKEPKTEGEQATGTADAATATDEDFSVAFSANGMVNPPHRIWIYPAESSPEKGICIHVDRFGEPQCEEVQ